MTRVAKAFLELPNDFVFSEKRAPRSPRKDHRLELLGGRILADETPLQGLIRELEEEEVSGFLSSKAKALHPGHEIAKVWGELHFIFRLSIAKEEYQQLTPCEGESYGFELLDRALVGDRDKLRTRLGLFTPKTVAIFAQLGMT